LVESVIQDHFEKFHDFHCDHPGCDFATTDAREMRDHQLFRHNTTVILTDTYGRELE
jgi:predicted deacylase